MPTLQIGTANARVGVYTDSRHEGSFYAGSPRSRGVSCRSVMPHPASTSRHRRQASRAPHAHVTAGLPPQAPFVSTGTRSAWHTKLTKSRCFCRARTSRGAADWWLHTCKRPPGNAAGKWQLGDCMQVSVGLALSLELQLMQVALENHFQITWPDTCRSPFDVLVPMLACQQMGLGQMGTAYPDDRFGPGVGPLFVHEVRCGGQEGRLQECFVGPVNSTGCPPGNTTSISCSGIVTGWSGSLLSNHRPRVGSRIPTSAACGSPGATLAAMLVCSRAAHPVSIWTYQQLRNPAVVRASLQLWLKRLCTYQPCDADGGSSVNRSVIEGMRLDGGTTNECGRLEVLAHPPTYVAAAAAAAAA